MSESKPFIEHPAGNPYADIPGTPYPEPPAGKGADELTRWFEGMRSIERRMNQEEKDVVLSLKAEVAKAANREEVQKVVEGWNKKAPLVSTRDTVAVRNFTLEILDGEEISIAVLFEPRRGVAAKDQPVRYLVQLL